ncbi:response regulator [Butyrivibrio sp. VCD2006]|uniref:response regulator n=1 Tax=Butyrivibrio sp. VCD2006 TaxID=1280664 RepID=UPI00047EFBEC|nr:response regulator [Butyrivibrio sp. VCD2006]
MDKRVLLIGASKSFMVSAIARGLQKDGFEIVNCEFNKEAILSVENKPQLYVLYLGDLDLSDPEKNGIEPLKYLDEAIDKERFFLYEVGSHEELDYASKFLSVIKVTETYLRPLDVQELSNALSSVVQSNEISEDQKKKILVVDDDGTMLRMIKTWLSVRYRVYMASSGLIALNFLQSNDVDLVLLDYMMPNMDGPTVLTEIRKKEKLANLPVMFLTSKSDKEAVVTVAALKPTKYLLKTMPKAKLVKAINEFFYGPEDK